MNYLQAVNSVLRRLREDEVTSVSQTAYSKMIGDFVNDANTLVTKAWDWTHLREKLTVTTVADTFQYTWTGDGNPVEVISAWNSTSNTALAYRSQTAFDRRTYAGQVTTGAPTEFTFRGIDSDGDTVIDVYPTPDAVYSLVFNAKVEQATLSVDTTKILVPWQPIVHMALAFAARERGETGGTSAAEYFSIADTYLADAVSLDASLHPHETVLDAGYYWPSNTRSA